MIPCRSDVPIFFIRIFLSKISVFRHFLQFAWSDRSHIAYLDRSYQYLQLLYWDYIRQVSQKIFISNFLSKFSVFRHFLKFEWSDRSHVAYLNRPHQYLQLLYYHHVLPVSQISHFWIISIVRCQNMSKVKTFWKVSKISKVSNVSTWRWASPLGRYNS